MSYKTQGTSPFVCTDVVDNTGGAGGGAGGGGADGDDGEFIDDTGEPTGVRGGHAIINLLLMLLTVLTAAATIIDEAFRQGLISEEDAINARKEINVGHKNTEQQT